jgi:flagellar hook-length control protein FliK
MADIRRSTVPSVASESNPPALNHASYAPRPPAPDRAPPQPFESLLDDSAPDLSAPLPAAESEPPRTAQSDSAPPAKADDSKPAASDAATSSDDSAAKTKAGAKDANAANAQSGKSDKINSETDRIAGDGKANSKTDSKTDAKADAKADAKTDAKSDAKHAEQSATPGDAIIANAQNTAAPAATGAPAAQANANAVAVVPVHVALSQAAPLVPQVAPIAVQVSKTAKINLATSAVADDKTAAKTVPQGKDRDVAASTSDGSQQVVAKDAGKDADKDAGKDQVARGAQSDDSHHATNASVTQPAANGDTHAGGQKTSDAPQPVALTAPAQTSPQTTGANPAPAPQMTPQAAAVPLAGIAIEIAGKALAGKNRFEIRLDPPELGRIEVRLDVDRDGNATTHMVADRADTLDLLRRDSSGLERALQDAGLKTGDNGLQFSLRDQSMPQQQHDGNSSPNSTLLVQDDLLPITDTTKSSYSRYAGMGSGVDIRI